MDDRIGPGQGIQRLPEVGQVRDQAESEGAAVMPRIHIQDVMAVLAEVAHDPRPALTAATCDDDPHADLLAGQVWPSGRVAGD